MFSGLLTPLPQYTDAYRLSQAAVTLAVFVVVVLAGVGSGLAELVAARTSSSVALRAGLIGVALTGGAVALAPGRAAFLVAFGGYGIALGAVDASGNMQA